MGKRVDSPQVVVFSQGVVFHQGVDSPQVVVFSQGVVASGTAIFQAEEALVGGAPAAVSGKVKKVKAGIVERGGLTFQVDPAAVRSDREVTIQVVRAWALAVQPLFPLRRGAVQVPLILVGSVPPVDRK
ncbi:MAG: hypothetical protein NZU63_12090 [Gemmataceae bacterium]|nr:hypothetical protein [Gemmataceae bacterium]